MSQIKEKFQIKNWELVSINPNNKNWEWDDYFCFWAVSFQSVIGFSLINLLNLTGFMAGVLLIQSAMPSAVLTYLVGSMYSEKRAVDNIASVIVASTLMSFITIPVVVYLSLRFFN